MDLPTSPTVFRFVGEGQGGTFAFIKPRPIPPRSSSTTRSSRAARISTAASSSGGTRPSSEPPDYKEPESIQYIGTYRCYTCVGVYFRVDENRCFCAHITGRNDSANPMNVVSHNDGEDIRRQVMSKLQEHAQANNWDPRHPKFGTSVSVVCPEPECEDPENGLPRRRTGYYAIKGIRDFLKSQAKGIMEELTRVGRERSNADTMLSKRAGALRVQADSFHVDTSKQGFVVNHHKMNDPGRAVYKLMREYEDFPVGPRPLDLYPFVEHRYPDLSTNEWLFISKDEDKTAVMQRGRTYGSSSYQRSD